MDFWMLIATFLHTAGMISFAGGLLWANLLFAWADRAGGTQPAAFADQAFRTLSLALSIGLSMLIAGGLMRYYVLHGDFRWGASSPLEVIDLLKILTFFLLWVSWGWCEVVIMHGLRRESPAPDGSVSEPYARARSRARRSLRFQLALATVTLLLALLGQTLRTAAG